MILDSIRFALAALWAHKLRASLTGLGMVIGNASVIIVVTVALTGRAFVLRLIEGVGSNLIYAYYEPGGNAGGEQQSDYINLEDVEAVRRRLGEQATAIAGVVKNYDRMVMDGREKEVAVLGSNLDYRIVRRLVIQAGRYFDAQEMVSRQKVCLLTVGLARRLYGLPQNAIGAVLKVHGLQFTAIGVFREGVDTFGQSEVSAESILIPITVMKYFTQVDRVDPLYISVRSAPEVEAVTAQVRQILTSRHHPGALYQVNNLANLLSTARRISFALTIVLLLVSAIALTISGIFIMNIMLVTVTERTREIGIRMAMGATRRQVLNQFLLEAGAISFLGGVVGIFAGVAVPLVARHFLTNLEIPISALAIGAAVLVSCSVGVIFGFLPASRAARLNPTEALRYE
ncbi:MAG: ABC transporter permease [Acidobacteria bacterium]|nr:ABC transporter permease [Acidobacteriota bacterium]